MYSPPHESEPRSQVVPYFLRDALFPSFDARVYILTPLEHALAREHVRILFLAFFASPPTAEDESTPARCDARHVSVRRAARRVCTLVKRERLLFSSPPLTRLIDGELAPSAAELSRNLC